MDDRWRICSWYYYYNGTALRLATYPEAKKTWKVSASLSWWGLGHAWITLWGIENCWFFVLFCFVFMFVFFSFLFCLQTHRFRSRCCGNFERIQNIKHSTSELSIPGTGSLSTLNLLAVNGPWGPMMGHIRTVPYAVFPVTFTEGWSPQVTTTNGDPDKLGYTYIRKKCYWAHSVTFV